MELNLNLKSDDPNFGAILAALSGIYAGTPVAGKPGVVKTIVPAAATEEITIQTLQGLLAKNKDKKDKIRSILGKFGAASISTLQVEDYPAVYEEFKKL